MRETELLAIEPRAHPMYEWKWKLTSWRTWHASNNIWRFLEPSVRLVRINLRFTPTLTGEVARFQTSAPEIKNSKVSLTVLEKRR